MIKLSFTYSQTRINQKELSPYMKIHFIGIGGVSMSGLARICLNLGYFVSGSDAQENLFTKELSELGAKIYIGQSEKNITEDIDLIVYTAAIHEDNPEWIAAKNSKIKIMTRSSFLGHIMKKYDNSIAIAGTHGKTTTTSMLSVIYSYSHLDPTILVGGNLKDINGNCRIGESENFITEACEYCDSFLDLFPTFGIVLNIEADHLDYFKDIDNIISSFQKFGKNIKQNGFIIANGDDLNVRTAFKSFSNTILFGYDERNDAVIRNTHFDKSGHGNFSILYKEQLLGPFQLQVPGTHNVMNATAAILTALTNGISISDVQNGIQTYTGVGRRFEYKGNFQGISVYDDYAHHPSEIRATLAASRYLHPNKLISIFQPHTYSRTKSLLDDFAVSFDNSDVVIITDIYASREIDEGIVSSEQLVEKIKEHGKNAVYLRNIGEIQKYLKNIAEIGDVIFTIGAGDVYKIGEQLLSLS